MPRSPPNARTAYSTCPDILSIITFSIDPTFSPAGVWTAVPLTLSAAISEAVSSCFSTLSLVAIGYSSSGFFETVHKGKALLFVPPQLAATPISAWQERETGEASVLTKRCGARHGRAPQNDSAAHRY